MSEQLTVDQYTSNEPRNGAYPVHVVAFADLCKHTEQATIITGQGAKLMQGDRCAPRSIERDANEISRANGMITKAFHRLPSNDKNTIGSIGFSVRSLTHTSKLEIADFTNGKHPLNHEYDLELHDYHDLLEKLKGDTEREVDEAYLRIFGSLAFKSL